MSDKNEIDKLEEQSQTISQEEIDKDTEIDNEGSKEHVVELSEQTSADITEESDKEEVVDSITDVSGKEKIDSSEATVSLPEGEQSDTKNAYRYTYDDTAFHPEKSNSYEEMDTSPLSMGEWVLTILALLLPCCVGIVLYFIWAFSKKGNVNRRNYCRASLAVMGVTLVIYLLIFVAFGVGNWQFILDKFHM